MKSFLHLHPKEQKVVQGVVATQEVNLTNEEKIVWWKQEREQRRISSMG
jgi:hypothetical protein